MVEIPVNTTALISFKAGPKAVITEDGRNISEVKDVQVISKTDGIVVCKAGSGKYSFSIEN